MATNTQIRDQILRRIQRIPVDRLKELNEYVIKLERTINKKEKILSFAGAWENIDNTVFEELTVKLMDKRGKNKFIQIPS